MADRLPALLDAFAGQCAALAEWLDGVPAPAWAAPSALPGWDVHLLVGHVVFVREGLVAQLGTRADERPVPAAEIVRRYRPAADVIAQRTREATGERTRSELVAALHDTADVVAAGVADRTVVRAARGPMTALDWVLTRLVELVVHCDDLSRSLPDREPVPLRRPALAAAVRTLAETLAAQAPGRSVEVRVPPFVAVQAIPGPRHTRGTPPNVVEATPLAWVRVATGRLGWAEALSGAEVTASGGRADLSPFLPLLS